MRFLSWLLVVLIGVAVFAPVATQAQDSDWHEQRTSEFVILYRSADEAIARLYAGFVDAVYDEVAALFAYRTLTPVTLRLYSTVEDYEEVNPLARRLPGVVAHADFRRHELAVVVQQVSVQSRDELQNTIRHELTHIVAAELSADRLNVGFQEGLAQFVEHPTQALVVKMQVLSEALRRDGLLRWDDLDDRDMVYGAAQVSYPECLSIVAFLVQHFSFAKVRAFLTLSAHSSGYRSALERGFGSTPDVLEREWRAWLPGYVAGGYGGTMLAAYDLSRAEALLQQGRYGEARAELEVVMTWLRVMDQGAVLRSAEQLLVRSSDGQAAERLANDARAALGDADYVRASALVVQAREAFARLDDQRQDGVLGVYAERAALGIQASMALTEALRLEGRLSYGRARAVVDQAAAQFAALGDGGGVDQALAVRARLDQRQSWLGTLLLVLGIGGIGFYAIRRLMFREVEVW